MGKMVEIKVPDIGDFSEVEVIDVAVAERSPVDVDDSLITVESDKATMDIPSPHAGTIKEVKVAIGDQVSEGTLLFMLELDETEQKEAKSEQQAEKPEPEGEKPAEEASAASKESQPAPQPSTERKETNTERRPPVPESPIQAGISGQPEGGKPHASPSVRRFARELGVDLTKVVGSAPKGRITREDVQAHVKAAMSGGASTAAGGFSLPEAPVIDFGKYGPTESQPLSKIRKLSGANLHRAWLTVPHVTQHDEADITELEAFRQSLKKEAEQREVRVTFLAFLIKAAVAGLQKFPDFNSSLDAAGENLIFKHYYHIGFACDTPDGLVVPVIRDADQKGVFDIAAELGDLSARARKKKISPAEMQGSSFTISSLGGIGGTAFTPIVNAPEVAILGVSRSQMKPVWDGSEFQPRLMLPLSLSYDHRVIDGAAAARFCAYLTQILTDMRRVLL